MHRISTFKVSVWLCVAVFDWLKGFTWKGDLISVLVVVAFFFAIFEQKT